MAKKTGNSSLVSKTRGTASPTRRKSKSGSDMTLSGLNHSDMSQADIKKLLKKITPTPLIETGLSDKEKQEKLIPLFHEILETLGLDMSNDSLAETPKRLAKMYITEIFRGLNDANFPKITVIENDMKYDQMIVIKKVRILSTCEHHFVTIDGEATIAYIPNKKVVGLSKINRIADFFSRRPQVQERLTKQIADCLELFLETDHIAVHINARHYCVISRGIQDENSLTATSDLRGGFKINPATRMEFLDQVSCRG
jgi:GTP cyclohydrolase IA